MEMNCFLCHLEQPNTAARAGLRFDAGDFGDANTATLSGLEHRQHESQTAGHGIAEAFDADGELKSGTLGIQDPTNANCAACHGEVHPTSDEPADRSMPCDLDYPQTATTGQVVSGAAHQCIGREPGRQRRTRPLVGYPRRAPVAMHRLSLRAEQSGARQRNPRAASPRTYVTTRAPWKSANTCKDPTTTLPAARAPRFNVAPENKGTMRRCENCHDASESHADWLPYIDTHMAAVACETCHIPQMYAPAIQSYDWTVVTAEGEHPLRSVAAWKATPNESLHWSPATNRCC